MESRLEEKLKIFRSESNFALRKLTDIIVIRKNGINRIMETRQK